MINKENLEYYVFLEELRRSGITNMFGATPYLMDEFYLDKKEAIKILGEWMDNYAEIEQYLEENNLVTKRED